MSALDYREANGVDAPARMRIDYRTDAPERLRRLPEALAILGFGSGSAPNNDPRELQLPLPLLDPTPAMEVWRAQGPVRTGSEGEVCFATDGQQLFGSLRIEEAAHRGIAAAAEHGYRTLLAFNRRNGCGEVLRYWNYFEAITDGDGDDERYRHFSAGRARGIGSSPHRFPAATAIGLPLPSSTVYIYWLAARAAGVPLENPRQVSAYRYPRQYGPQPPSFARATLLPDASSPQLLISGTASVVGHETRHLNDLRGQFDETLLNLHSLVDAARLHPGGLALPPTFGAGSRLKVYLRDPRRAAEVSQWLQTAMPDVPVLLLHGEICRRDLLIEIDGLHSTG